MRSPEGEDPDVVLHPMVVPAQGHEILGGAPSSTRDNMGRMYRLALAARHDARLGADEIGVGAAVLLRHEAALSFGVSFSEGCFSVKASTLHSRAIRSCL